jgi:hypothetical protein
MFALTVILQNRLIRLSLIYFDWANFSRALAIARWIAASRSGALCALMIVSHSLIAAA